MTERFRINGLDHRDVRVSLETTAESLTEAVEAGRAMGLAQVSVDVVEEARYVGGGGVSREQFVRFNHELADIADLGIPLPEGLRVLARGMGEGALRASASEIAADVERGMPVADAVRRSGGKFPPYYADLMEAAVASGDLGEMLRSFADYSDSVNRIQGSIRRAMFYPTIVLVVGICALIIITAFLVPELAVMYSGFGIEAPRSTRAIIVISRIVRAGWAPLAIVAAAIVAFLIFARASPALWHVRAAIGRRLPGLGTVLVNGALSRFFAALSVSLKQGLAMQSALGVAALACGDKPLGMAARRMRERMDAGQSFGEVARDERDIPEVAAWMIGLGERDGRAHKNAEELAKLFRTRAEIAGEMLGMTLAAASIMLGGGFVGFVMCSLFQPLVTLMNKLGAA